MYWASNSIKAKTTALDTPPAGKKTAQLDGRAFQSYPNGVCGFPNHVEGDGEECMFRVSLCLSLVCALLLAGVAHAQRVSVEKTATVGGKKRLPNVGGRGFTSLHPGVVPLRSTAPEKEAAFAGTKDRLAARSSASDPIHTVHSGLEVSKGSMATQLRYPPYYGYGQFYLPMEQWPGSLKEYPMRPWLPEGPMTDMQWRDWQERLPGYCICRPEAMPMAAPGPHYCGAAVPVIPTCDLARPCQHCDRAPMQD